MSFVIREQELEVRESFALARAAYLDHWRLLSQKAILTSLVRRSLALRTGAESSRNFDCTYGYSDRFTKH
jgi:hypothetical protein